MRWFLPVFLLLGCHAPPPPAQLPLMMKTWDLPPGSAGQLVNAVNRLLESDKNGKATEGPAGSLVVVAPAGVLGGVDELVKRTVAAPAAPPPRNVEIEVWVVRGVPAATASRGPGLSEIGGALDAIEHTDGPLALTLQTTRRLRSLDGERGDLKDDDLEVVQEVTIAPGTSNVVADLTVRVPRAAEVDSRLALANGQVAVLSQAGARTDEGPSSLYLLVRPTIVE